MHGQTVFKNTRVYMSRGALSYTARSSPSSITSSSSWSLKKLETDDEREPESIVAIVWCINISETKSVAHGSIEILSSELENVVDYHQHNLCRTLPLS